MELTSRHLFLGTTEILEQVFLQADMRTVLFAQSVCKKWYNLITTSPSIQQHLFFQPVTGSGPMVQNPLLAEMFPLFFHCTSDLPRSEKSFTPEEVKALPLGQNERNAAFLYEKATWRRMLICQPPIHSIIRLVITSYMGGDGSDFERLTEKGIEPRLQVPDIMKETSQEPPTNLPIQMESLFYWVTGGSGESNSWMFIWRDPHVEDPIPHELRFCAIDIDKRGTLEECLKRDGVAMLETAVDQCTGPPGPWQFESKFLVR